MQVEAAGGVRAFETVEEEEIRVREREGGERKAGLVLSFVSGFVFWVNLGRFKFGAQNSLKLCG